MKHFAPTLFAFVLCLPAYAQTDVSPDCRAVAERLIAIAGEMSGEISLSDDELEDVLDGIASDLDGDDSISCADILELSDEQIALLFIGTSGS